jgi:hypothetical protein
MEERELTGQLKVRGGDRQSTAESWPAAAGRVCCGRQQLRRASIPAPSRAPALLPSAAFRDVAESRRRAASVVPARRPPSRVELAPALGSQARPLPATGPIARTRRVLSRLPRCWVLREGGGPGRCWSGWRWRRCRSALAHWWPARWGAAAAAHLAEGRSGGAGRFGGGEERRRRLIWRLASRGLGGVGLGLSHILVAPLVRWWVPSQNW